MLLKDFAHSVTFIAKSTMWRSGDKLRYSWQLRQKSEWKLVQNAAGDLALCPSYTLLSEKWVNAHLVQDFLKNEGFTYSFLQKRNQSNDQQEKCILYHLVAN